MQRLDSQDFTQFFKAIHGFDPFEWQKRFAKEVFAEGFHDVVRAPTGCGKTSILDVALFQLALQAEREPEERTAARRICFVVDRRIVVDEVTRHACKIYSALRSAAASASSNSVVRTVAERLTAISGESNGNPISVVRLRGAVYRDDGWAANPIKPSIIISTVDQIGSRLLFRGYGVGRRSRPLQAGLLAFDTVVILDEAHLSGVFAETLDRVGRFQEWAQCPPLPMSRRVRVVRMSATITEDGRSFEMSPDERSDHRLAPRLEGQKLAELIRVPVEAITKAMLKNQHRLAHNQEQKNRQRMAQELAKNAVRLANRITAKGEEPPRVIAILANRVATARQVFDLLRENRHDGSSNDAILLTGRIRPYDRDRLLEKWLPKIKAGRETGPDRALFVVATQTVEVGANLDFDALVTEAAPLDALRQRFGRLDRLGSRYERGVSSLACVLIRSDQEHRSEDDPVYGSTIAHTWNWLQEQSRSLSKPELRQRQIDGPVREIDFGVGGMEPRLPRRADKIRPMLAPQNQAPVLLPAHLDAWVQTNPIPEPDPDVAPFLHGRADALADVQVVWRADLKPGNVKYWERIVSLMPPRSREALAVPVYEVRAWLGGCAEANVADVEGIRPEPMPGGTEYLRKALCWRGPDDAQVVESGQVRPGDTIVVPASYGGADEFGWNPNSKKAVEDVAEACLAEVIASYPADAFRLPRLRFRVHRDILPLMDGAAEALIDRYVAMAVRALRTDDQDPRPFARSILRAVLDRLSTTSHRAAAEALLTKTVRLTIEPYPDDSGVVLSAALPLRLEGGTAECDADSEFHEPEGEEASFIPGGRQVTLAEHSYSVAEKSAAYARECGLGPFVEVLRAAGFWHDVGKRDRRFQAWLYGSELKALAALADGSPLAKSGRDLRNWGSSEAFGYPNGSRHEFVSVTLLDQALGRSDDASLLTRFLVGTHHGYGRPFPPVVDDQIPVVVSLNYEGRELKASSNHELYRLEGGWVELFWQMVSRYGWWGIAFLEAVLITADRSVSKREQLVGGRSPGEGRYE